MAGAVLAGAVSLVASACATDLGTIGGTSSTAWGVNADGTVVGVSTDASGVPRAFRRDDGVNEALPPLAGFSESEARSINAGGVVVGTASDGAAAKRAVRWPAGGGIEELGGLGGTTSAARDVNAAGVVVGFSTLAGSSAAVATVWDPLVGHAVALPVPAGTTESYAQAVADNGAIVGWSNGANGAQALRWTGANHTIEVLGASVPVQTPLTVTDVNAAGVAVGSQLVFTNDWREFRPVAVMWPAGTTTAVQIGSLETSASAIDDDGTIVGVRKANAAAWSGPSHTETVLTGLGGASRAFAVADGRPVGDSVTPEGERHATEFDRVAR